MTKLLDPICDMVVDIAEARDQGLTLELGEPSGSSADAIRLFAFCSHGCLTKFAKEPARYIPKVEAWLAAGATETHHAAHAHPDELPVIDSGMREWYKSCRCCLSEAYPKVVEALDAEKVT